MAIRFMNRNSKKALRVNALWDDEVGIWSASSKDVAGLAIEATTKEVLIERLKTVIPELLELNHTKSNQLPHVELVVKGHQNFRLAS